MGLGVIVPAFGAALAQVFDPRFRRVLWRGVGLTVLLLVAVTAGVLWLLNAWLPDEVSLPFGITVRWLDEVLSGASVAVMLVLSTVLMVPVASLFTSLFLDDVAAAVEDRHYPHLPDVPALPLADVVIDSVSFFGVLVAVNAACLIVYLISGPFVPVIFWAVNGYLLGREYFQLAAMRRLGRAGARAARRRNWATAWLAGALMAVPLTIPLVNLLVPILGAATFTHIFHALERVDPRPR